MERIKKGFIVKKIMVAVLIIGTSFCFMKSSTCTEELTEIPSEADMLLLPPDDYKAIESKIQQMSVETTYKNMQVAKEAQGLVQDPGIIEGRVMVTTEHSDIPERHSGNTVVYIENVNGNNYKPVQRKHVVTRGYIAFTKDRRLPPEAPIMDQWNVEFIPHVLPVLKGSTIDFPNTDTVRHNVYSPVPIPGSHRMLSLGTYGPEVIKTIRLDKVGEIPLRCNVHQEMSAFIVVLGNPYFTVTNRKGEFTIDNVPSGTYILKTWHEKFKPVSIEVTVSPNQTVKVVLPDILEKRDTSHHQQK
ncbi:MAG: hypothetical protein SCARUB_01133 [Candidatus Scalindua rubra]|uniref:Uncharacterized protein n=1 Tax=Candidatus Scalindua rubra TaxID=1872076 RepID=A0A1E3XDI0_9BACT|nr:MAG: hypothetical protein SCARUB_01133 [Candidatus Scalindua rubra]